MPLDEPEDMSFPTWAGVVPMRQVIDAPLADETTADAPLPDYLATWVDSRTDGR
jgi:hypothetical protein